MYATTLLLQINPEILTGQQYFNVFFDGGRHGIAYIIGGYGKGFVAAVYNYSRLKLFNTNIQKRLDAIRQRPAGILHIIGNDDHLIL